MTDFDSLLRAAMQSYAVTPDWPRLDAPPSDVVLHLPVLHYFAGLCATGLEFGVRTGQSTLAFLAAGLDLVSVDIERSPFVGLIERTPHPGKFRFIKGDTGRPGLQVGEVDLLYVDTLHTREHVEKELTHYGRLARKFLVFHDTETCGVRDRSGPDPRVEGILPAIHDFVDRFPGEYEVVYETPFCNGLLVLRRKPEGA